jgi:hypothetical protein
MSDFRGVRLKYIWNDCDLAEFECLVDTVDFRGRTTCYAGLDDATTFGRELTTFLETHDGKVAFSTGLEGDTKAVVLEVFATDGAKHLAMKVHLATDGRPEEVSRLDHRFQVEPWALQLFARQLAALRTVGDEAALFLESPG